MNNFIDNWNKWNWNVWDLQLSNNVLYLIRCKMQVMSAWQTIWNGMIAVWWIEQHHWRLVRRRCQHWANIGQRFVHCVCKLNANTMPPMGIIRWMPLKRINERFAFWRAIKCMSMLIVWFIWRTPVSPEYKC